jgi:peptide/nickel transport system permease protein
MKNQIRQIFRSGKFMTGFIVIMSILLLVIIYPLFNPGNPLEMIGYNSFIKPGTYFSLYDSLSLEDRQIYRFRLEGADELRIYNKMSAEDREAMKDWLVRYGEREEVPGLTEEDIDVEDRHTLLDLWWEHYDPTLRLGMTIAASRAYQRLDTRIDGILNLEDYEVFTIWNEEDGEFEVHQTTVVNDDYVNVNDVVNRIWLPLGTENFGRDTLKMLVSAIGTSLMIGLVAGSIATAIGLLFGLLAGYVGGIVDDIIMFFTNLFTVIPGIVLLILISYSIGQEQRGAMTVAVVIGITSWVWTTRSVRSQVLSLRNRDHVNLSKLSGHSMPKIILKDILPYVASYVVMAFVLQVSSGILAEAGLSMLGLGPKTTETATLGLMMNWAMRFNAHQMGAWWAYYPVVGVIALISFSLNLMNTGLDQVFNPQLRD